jgi:hypothetical protein
MFRRSPTPEQWTAQRLAFVPGPWRERVRRQHAGKLKAAAALPFQKTSEAQRLANLWLLDTTQRLEALRVPVTLTDTELCDMARDMAQKVMDVAATEPGKIDKRALRAVNAGFVVNYITALPTKESIRARMAGFVARYGIKPPDEEFEDGPAIARMTDELWWRRQLRKTQARALEGEAIRLGYVHRHAEIYASTVTVERRAQQKRRNAAALEGTGAINLDTGEVYNLSELAAKSVANPRIRRGELMTRIKGFEHIALGLGHVADFVTLTCPSKYHPKRTEGARVVDNPKFQGFTPRDAQQYLTKLWANIRAKLHRQGVRVYGFRITEAHHDGCPHWHLLLFMEAGHVGAMRAIVRAYALREDGNEPGAQKNRVDFVSIDPAKGTAAGYIAKYVSKNIDGGGYEVQGDVEGGDYDAITPSHRIEAWASTWGIRQFQQIGGPPVGVWRELRRTAESQDHGEAMQLARAAADAGNWRSYVEAMGGPTVERKCLPLRVAYTRAGERWNFKDQLPYEAPLTRYGEIAKAAPIGLLEVKRGHMHQSCRYRWRIQRTGPGIGSRVVGFQGQGEAMAPWTRVNNCSEGLENESNANAKNGHQGGAGQVERSPGTYPHHGGGIRGTPVVLSGGHRAGTGQRLH